MDISEIVIAGDTPGVEWRVPVFRFTGTDAGAPSVYLQAALHASELPGTALLHFLCARLRQAEEDGAILGDITVIPQANPIGLSQSHFGEMQGRFDLGSRTNFNRDFPLIALDARDDLALPAKAPHDGGEVDRPAPAERRLLAHPDPRVLGAPELALECLLRTGHLRPSYESARAG